MMTERITLKNAKLAAAMAEVEALSPAERRGLDPAAVGKKLKALAKSAGMYLSTRTSRFAGGQSLDLTIDLVRRPASPELVAELVHVIEAHHVQARHEDPYADYPVAYNNFWLTVEAVAGEGWGDRTSLDRLTYYYGPPNRAEPTPAEEFRLQVAKAYQACIEEIPEMSAQEEMLEMLSAV